MNFNPAFVVIIVLFEKHNNNRDAIGPAATQIA